MSNRMQYCVIQNGQKVTAFGFYKSRADLEKAAAKAAIKSASKQQKRKLS